MSIRPIPTLICLLAALVLSPADAAARGLAEARLELFPGKPATVRVEGRFAAGEPGETRAFSFVTSHAGVGDLERRISGLKVFGAGGEIPHRTGPSGAVFADDEISGFSYTVDLSPPADQTLGAHVSWFEGAAGVLMLLDLLPATNGEADVPSVRIKVPDGLKIISLQKGKGASGYSDVPVSESVFMIARDVRTATSKADTTRVGIAIDSEWQFPDAFVSDTAGKLMRRYSDVFWGIPFAEVQVMLIRVPDGSVRDRWRAETRGANILIVSSPSTYKNLGEQVIHEQLRHELLHLWIPNSLELVGNYSWFYEGFIFYRALVAGAEERRITFSDVLKTLSELKRRADTGNWRPLAGNEVGAPSPRTLQARGALVAFAADSALAVEGRDLDDLLKAVFRGARFPGRARDADEYIIRVMRVHTGLTKLVEDAVLGDVPPDWDRTLAVAGLAEDASAKIVPMERPTSRQRTFLRRLGYNVVR